MIKFLLQRPIAVIADGFHSLFHRGLVTYFTIPVSLLPDIAIRNYRTGAGQYIRTRIGKYGSKTGAPATDASGRITGYT